MSAVSSGDGVPNKFLSNHSPGGSWERDGPRDKSSMLTVERTRPRHPSSTTSPVCARVDNSVSMGGNVLDVPLVDAAKESRSPLEE